MSEKPYTPIDCDFHDELEAASTLGKIVELVVRDDNGALLTIRAVIADLGFLAGDAAAGEFMTLADGRRYRFDRIVSIDGKPRPGSD